MHGPHRHSSAEGHSRNAHSSAEGHSRNSSAEEHSRTGSDSSTCSDGSDRPRAPDSAGGHNGEGTHTLDRPTHRGHHPRLERSKRARGHTHPRHHSTQRAPPRKESRTQSQRECEGEGRAPPNTPIGPVERPEIMRRPDRSWKSTWLEGTSPGRAHREAHEHPAGGKKSHSKAGARTAARLANTATKAQTHSHTPPPALCPTHPSDALHVEIGPCRGARSVAPPRFPARRASPSVSYTHLTLPTNREG